MNLTLFGLPNSGKTTVFNALTRSAVSTATYASPGQPNVATVKVPDDRVLRLAEMYRPRKVTPADVTYTDLAGFERGFGRGEGPSGQLLGILGKADALLAVVRAFPNPDVPHPESTVDPARDLESLRLELILADLAIVERRLERIAAGFHKVKPAERETQERERQVLERYREALTAEQPVREVPISPTEELQLRSFQFLTAKPLLVLVNLGEEQLPEAAAIEESYRARFGGPGRDVATLCGKIEMEIGQLDPDDAALFLHDLGIAESGLDRVIRLSYDLLGLVSFFTVGEDEVRAWPIRRGLAAPQAAGTIHTDFERGFIRAEVVRYEELVTAGSWAEARRRGQLRREGKTYQVQDGDVIHFLFNV